MVKQAFRILLEEAGQVPIYSPGWLWLYAVSADTPGFGIGPFNRAQFSAMEPSLYLGRAGRSRPPQATYRTLPAMLRFLIQRLLAALLTIFVTTIAVSMLIHLVPGDPVQIMYAQSQGTTPEQLEEVRQRLGLDQPLVTQYLAYLGRILQGDPGVTIRGEQPVLELLLLRLPNTLILAAASARRSPQGRRQKAE